jgi:hypothetical protein
MDNTIFEGQDLKVFEDIISNLKSDMEQKNATSDPYILSFWEYLKYCEALFVSGDYKENANPDDVESMLSLHLLNYKIPKTITTLLRGIGLPTSEIEENISESHPIWDGWVYKNGTLFSFAKYCQLDPLWALMFVIHAKYKHHPDLIHPFIKQPCIDSFNSSSPSGARIAIIGDWGTGAYIDGHIFGSHVKKCPAQLVIDGIMNLDPRPDYILHLGDVYYAGTKEEERDKFIGLLDALPADYKGKFFTMNSNHEMYDGANGLFEVTICNPKFAPQEGSTYFSLEVGDWIIVGLDSAYYDKSHLYMDGAIFNENGGQEQVEFLKMKEEKARAEGKQLLLLTHHNPIEYDASGFVDSKLNEGSLWEQVVDKALGGRIPDAWYWGHIHNGIVYDIPELLQRKDNPLKIDLKPGEDPKFRCCGHASIPFGKATGLDTPGIPYFAQTAMDPPHPTASQNLRVLNGFAVIDINGSSFKETFYEVSNTYPDGKPNPIWHSPTK